MAGVAEIVAGAIKGTADTGLSIWNAYQTYKNNQYQKDLQKEIFAREDNAIQRRVADAEKAGFNKFSVIGEGSNAGSAVSVQAPHISEDMGSKIADSLSTMYSLATQKALAKKADADARTADIAFKLANNRLQSDTMALNLEKMDFYQGLGLDTFYNPDFNQVGYSYPSNDSIKVYNNTPFGRMNLNNFGQSDIGLELKEFENEYKWLKPLIMGLQALNQTAGTVNSFRRPRRWR